MSVLEMSYWYLNCHLCAVVGMFWAVKSVSFMTRYSTTFVLDVPLLMTLAVALKINQVVMLQLCICIDLTTVGWLSISNSCHDWSHLQE